MTDTSQETKAAGFAAVRLFDLPSPADREYTYAVPPHLREAVKPGIPVRVPFGRGGKVMSGVVTSLGETSAYTDVKFILSAADESLALTPEMADLARFLTERTLCTYGEAVRTVLPPGFSEGMPAVKCERTVYPVLSRSRIEELLDDAVGLRSAAHRVVLRYFYDSPDPVPVADLCEKLSVSVDQIRTMVKKEWLAFGTSEVIRDPYLVPDRARDTSPICLSRAQSAAYETLLSLQKTHSPRAALLFGVTGSGKTKVMMKVMDEVIAEGKGVIMLVPEIALTPQTVSLFSVRYGPRVAVIHSGLSAGERYDAWRRIRRGDVDLVIGTRSAIFAPLDNIGLIIMDEEHEHTYKSESDPRYHARDVAAFRCAQTGSLLILASATPALESFYKAKQGIYTLVPLRERYGGAVLPTVEVIDMREEVRAGLRSPYSDRLSELLRQTVSEGHQAVLFLNRRGYHTSVQCRECGEALTCPHCSVALTFHTSGGAPLRCHCCGYGTSMPRQCPHCGSEHLGRVGFGTEKAQSDLSVDLPDLRVMRMDADTTTGKLSYDRMLDGFRAGKADVLLGTQMVTKGHDFPGVTLVGVLLADLSLYVNDFRASERTFSQLTQVIGRAGRSSSPGVAIVQTFAPHNDVIRYACAQDYEGFYEQEIALRRQTVFPPFCDIVTVLLSSAKESDLFEACDALKNRIAALGSGDFADQKMMVFGPFEAPVYKVAEKYRMRMSVKCRLTARTREMFRVLLSEFSQNKKITVGVDFNPLTF